MHHHTPTLEDIRRAAERISGDAHRTPVLTSQTFHRETDANTFFKMENLQRVGAFKIRGALNRIRSLGPEEKARGVITYSSGNHGQATAAAARIEGARCVVVMPEDARAAKRDATIAYGAEVVTAGMTSEDRYARAMELHEEFGYTVIPPYDDPFIIAGQGTCGLEIAEEVPGLDILLVPVGGGGLISGCAVAVKSLMPAVQVIGVETEGADDATQSFRRGVLTRYESTDTIADGMRNLSVGKLNFAVMREYVDDMVTVSDTDVLSMMRFFFERMKTVVEPTGSVAAAAVRLHRGRFAGKTVCAIVSGGNIGVADFCSLTGQTTA